jgi:hypothetical protein
MINGQKDNKINVNLRISSVIYNFDKNKKSKYNMYNNYTTINNNNNNIIKNKINNNKRINYQKNYINKIIMLNLII